VPADAQRFEEIPLESRAAVAEPEAGAPVTRVRKTLARRGSRPQENDSPRGLLSAERPKVPSIYIRHEPTTGVLVVFFEVVGKLVVIPGLAQPDMSYRLQASRLIEGARRDVDLVISPGVPKETGTTLLAEPTIDIGGLVFDGAIPLEAALYRQP
jgi:hypothetical protein